VSSELAQNSEKAMLAFVIKSVKNPGSVTEDDIKQLKDLAWDDRDMSDALARGMSMIDQYIMMEVFQMDANCVVRLWEGFNKVPRANPRTHFAQTV